MIEIEVMKEVVFQGEDDLFYFWEETWAYAYGPFATEFEAHKNLSRYCEIVLG